MNIKFSPFILLTFFIISSSILGADSQRIGIYGGTFDPPHLGHTAAIRAAINGGKLDEVIIVVSENQGRKNKKLSVEHRRRMAELHFKGEKKIRFMTPSELEVYQKNGYNGFVKNFSEAKRGNGVFLISGSDVIENIADGTYKPIVAQNVTYIGVAREGSEIKDFGGVKGISVSPDYSTSSTNIRDGLGKGRKPDGLKEGVLNDILNNKLYNVKVRSCRSVWSRLLKSLQ